MKKFCRLFLFVFLFSFFSFLSYAQEIKPVRFITGDFKPDNNIIKQSFKKEKLQSSLYQENYFVLVQFSSIPSLILQQQLKKLGVELHTYLPANAYLASVNKNFDFSLAKKFNITSINVVPDNYKIDPALLVYKESYDKENLRLMGVTFHSIVDKKTVTIELQKLGALIVATKLNPVNTIFIQPDTKIISSIAALPFVSYISLQSMKDKPLNYNDVATHGISALDAPNGKNLNGKGVTVGIGDNADISTHIDFAGRLISRTPWYADFHGTHVAGTAAGAGIIDVKNHGMAPKATIIDQYFSDIITQAATYITDYDMVLTNNSYYSDNAGCTGEGAYDNLSNYIDGQIYNNDHLLHVIAAGNDGASSCSPFTSPYGTVKSGWQCGKNVLTVGAMNTYNDSITNFSSSGPVNDGRIKPEIVCGGWNILSTIQNNAYGYDNGTSMASPVATGSLALMYERYRQLHNGTDPKSALMKAIICNTAEDIGNPGPDYNYGFGMLNARRAVETIDSNWYFVDSIVHGTNATKTIVLPVNARRLKVMLYWADKEAALNSATTLVNDLDLTVSEPSTLVHYPLILNPAPAHVTDNAIEGADHTNNIEQVTIENPVAGSYTINVNAFAVPFGPQNYILTYEILDSSVTVEYPYGGETWVAGETENIRWSAYGSENNNFTIDYSIDSGNTWTTINNNVPSTSRLYSWTVPSVVTNGALVRITRNGTNFTDQSNFPFTILGRPVVTVTNLCQGYVSLNWGSIAGATSYDVLQLIDDSMDVIANTTGTSFLVTGLNKYQTYWFGVRAKNGAVAGRRSLSVSTIPNSGACTMTVFNNDLTIDSILAPNTARQFFSNATNATQPVTIQIRNLGSIPISGPFNVSYNCQGGSATEVVDTTIPAGGKVLYTFSTPYISTPSGFHYNFQAWVADVADSNHENDTAYKTVNLLANPVILFLPVTESFETTDSGTYTSNVLGLNGNDAFDFSSNTSNGRLRTFVNTGFAHSGIQSATLDQTPFESYYTSDSLTATYNLSNYPSGQLRYDFYYKSPGQIDSPANRIWIRGSENAAWVQAYDLYVNQPTLGLWQHGNFNINDVLNSAVPAQNVSSTFQIRFGEAGFTSTNSPNPETPGLDNGFTFDDLSLTEAFNDVGLSQVLSPVKSGCALTSTSPVSIQVKNYNNTTINSVQVNYQINGGAIITDTISSIAPNATLNYTFNETANLAAYIDYNINFWVKYSGDTYHQNDSILNYVVHNSPIINTYPYLQGFENNNGYFYAKGTNSSWQWGTPSKTIINKAANGNNAWVTNLTGNYNNNELSYLYSPCFDLSSLVHPELSFSDIYQVETGYDYTWVEYSTDGLNWQKLGSAESGTNWYNDSVGKDWNGLSLPIWHVASIDIPTNSSSTRFRFVLNSDEGVTYAGVGIDDIHIFEKAPVYTGAPITSLTQNVSGNNWIDFSSGGNRIVSINPNGNDLGTTNVQVYPYSGPARSDGNQYYLDRNIVVQPSNPPTSYVSVRFYYTDSEVNRLINDTGCASCTKPADAYSMGVTKYSGSVADENGTLADDLTGLFIFIPHDSTYVAPNDNGYYSEFEVNSFSEFWLNNGGANGATPLPLTLVNFIAAKQNSRALLQWTTENELNTDKYIIERSSDERNYTGIGAVIAQDLSGVNQYAYIDSIPSAGINYYRLEIISRNGVITYSPIRKINFGNKGDDFIVYPNPVVNTKLFIASTGNCINAKLSDASGKLIRSYTLSGRNNTLDVSGVAKGVYELKIFSDISTDTEKILIQ